MLAEASTVSMTTAVTSFMDVVSTVMTTITGNATLMAFFCAGISVVRGCGFCPGLFCIIIKMILVTRCELLQ